MKTIQEVLRKLKVDEIEKCYFDEHPIELLSLKGVDAVTIGKYRKKASSAFQSFVGKLRNMEIVDNSDDPWILFVCKSTCENRLNGHTVELIHLKELMEEKDLSKVETYAYEFTEQKEALGFLVADTKLTQDNIMDVVVDFLYEISFFGYEHKHLAKEIKKLDEAMKEIEEHPERLERVDFDELFGKYGISKEEINPEEDKLRKAYYKAEMEYIQYCRIAEMEKIKKVFSMRTIA